MPRLFRRPLPAFAVLLAAVLPAAAALAEPIGGLRFLGVAPLPHDLKAEGWPVGGLSGLDYDAATDSFLVLSDDRSDFGPARFHELRLIFVGERLHSARIEATTMLRQADNTLYPGSKSLAPGMIGTVPDPESIRIDPLLPETLWWTSEGDRARGLPPFARRVTRSGLHLYDLPVPPLIAADPARERGVRANLGFESLSFSPDGQSLWLATESALYEDGPTATPERGTLARLLHATRDGTVLAQYAYPLDPIPGQPVPGKWADNGVTEILALDDARLLVVERGAVQGADNSFVNYIRLYEAYASGATDIAALPSLANKQIAPMEKRLVLNLRDAGIGYVDNIEGVTFGPRLDNGHRTLILVSDNNFNPAQITQILAFEVLP